MRDCSDFNEALTKLHRLHQESGEERLAPIPYWQHGSSRKFGVRTSRVTCHPRALMCLF